VNTSRRFISIAAALAGTMFLFAFACNKGPEEAQAAADPAGSVAAPPAAAEGRLIPIAVTNDGFSPSTIEAKKGEAITLRFTRTTKSDCLKAIAIPDLKIERDLPMNTPVDVTIKPDKEGKLVFQCWMAMVRGTINVSGT
jgi:plastocyanin domain-containing protein